MNKRLDFIDAIRSYAILSMVFGHSMGVLLADSFRNDSNLIYQFHVYISGITAPVFFFASGLIFTYLLFKDGKFFNKTRLLKGFKRSLYLITVGFIIQISIFRLFERPFGFLNYSHVLQCIGIAIFIISLLYLVSASKRIIFSIIVFILFNFVFLYYPIFYYSIDHNDFNIFTLFFSRNYTIFPAFPWLGFTLAGSVFGVLISKFKFVVNTKFLIFCIIFGFIVRTFSWYYLYFFYDSLFSNPDELLKLTNFTYFRFGEVLMVYGIISLIIKYAKVPKWILTPGKETLMIYVTHNILIYASLFGIGYTKFFYHDLSMWQTLLLTTITIIFFIFFANFINKQRTKHPWLNILK